MRDVSSIGFIGLGHMGYHMVNNLAKAGKKVYVYDVVPEAMARFKDTPNVEAVAKASDLADKVKTVVLMLPNSPPCGVGPVWRGRRSLREDSGGLLRH